MNCLICKKEIEELYPEELSSNISSSPVSDKMWLDGSVDYIHPGYGSDFDTETFILCLCDNCIKKGIEDGLIQKEGHYL